MSRFRLGTANGSPFFVPDDLVTQTVTVFGKKGSGKTNTAVVLAEELLKVGQQVVVFEPLGKWYGLKSSKDGKKPGHSVVLLGGTTGDLPLDPSSGEVVADFVVRHRLSCVVSTSDFDTEAAARRFVTAFLTRFYRLKRHPEHQTPVAIILEEARTFAPQQVRPDETKMLHAVTTVARNGRNFGIGVYLVDQRPASINKDVSSQTEMLICHQITSSHDKKAVEDWVKDNVEPAQFQEFKATVAKLPLGEAWICSPVWLEFFGRVKIRERETFDSSATPKVGGLLQQPEKTTKVNLDSLREAMSETIEIVKANDPDLLKGEIRELKKKLQSQGKTTGPDVEATVRAAVLKERSLRLSQEKKLHAKIEGLAAGFDHLMQKWVDQGKAIRQSIEELRQEAKPSVNGELVVSPGRPIREPPTEHATILIKAPVAMPAGREELTPSETSILDASATFPGGATRKRISIYSGRSIKSSSFQGAFKTLSDRGLLQSSGDRYSPTAAGSKLALPTKGADFEDWLRKLKPSEAKVLQALRDAFPARMRRDEVAETTEQSVKSSSFQGAFKTLCELELIEGTGDYRLNEDLA